MLDFIYYPVSFILWCWHWVFGHVLGESNAFAWVLSVMFLVFTLRAIMYKPFVKQVRSMRQMQVLGPEIKKIQKKYANDKTKQAQEMQKLQSEHGFSPLGGCLPMLLQIPVFIGLFHVLREFRPGKTENYFFDAQGVQSYVSADLFGARLSNWITQPANELAEFGVQRPAVILVAVPLMLLAAVLTHLTARHSVARQNPESATPQTAIMNKVTLYLFPIGVIVGGAVFPFPIGLLVYWLANNSWTLMQQNIVYSKIDREEEEKKVAAVEKRNSLAPKPGQKPSQAKRKAAPANPAEPVESTGSVEPETAIESTAEAESAAPTNVQAPKKDTTGQAKPKPNSNGSDAGTTVPGLISDRTRSKKSGRRNR